MITLQPGARVDTYKLIRPLGRGGFAEVWEAQSETDGRRVALKVLTELRADSARALERFQQEGQLAASLSSPRCVYVFGAGAWEGCPYIAMELMPGGTLAGRIEAGPLESRAAVDCVLDVLDGLEAAQQAGILHRDVKPSNVFLAADGRAKIGDFGISKSLETDSKLSQTGVFLGTPYYASPEQIAAEPLDLRSDLYSVGAMLYELVTGKLPYLGTNPSQVLAQVLTREPVPFAQHPASASVPAGLQRVVMRLLAKQREKRYQTYEETRAALAPFSTRGLTPAPLPRRFGAIVVDLLLFLPINLFLGAVLVRNSFRGQLAVSLSMTVAQVTYFSLLERYAGASVGKRLLGLRVTTADGGTPTALRVLARTLIFISLYAGPGIIVQQLAVAGVQVGRGTLSTVAPALVEILALVLIVVPMRRRNGFAGIHDILSRTRVMAMVTRARAGTLTATAAGASAEPVGEAGFGPYRSIGVLWSRTGESLSVARDEALRRDVWIHRFSGDAQVPPVEVLRERGAGSLPWLQRGTSGGETWDAYGAPQGMPFLSWAATGGLGWKEMRGVLRSLAGELGDRFARSGSAGPLSAARVWVNPQGRALLLDFPAESSDAAEAPATEVNPENWREFLASITALGLEDRATGRPWQSAPLPAHARAILAQLSPSGPPATSVAAFGDALENASNLPDRVTSFRRAGPVGILAAVPAVIVALRLVLPAVLSGFPPWYNDLAINAQAYIDTLRSANRRAGGDSMARHTADAIQVILARARIEALQSPQIGKPALDNLPPRARAEVDSAAARYPAPDSQTVARARAFLAGRIHLVNFQAGLGTVPAALAQGMKTLGYLGIAGVLLALIFRGGLLFTLFGIAVQRTDGSPAGRLRCLGRSLAAWGPLLALTVVGRASSLRIGPARPGVPVTATSGPSQGSGSTGGGGADVALMLLAVGGAAFAVWRPTRGLAERVAGVVLVPR